MARYKHYEYGQMRRLAIRYDRQIVPGTFEYALSTLIDERLRSVAVCHPLQER